MSTQIKIQIQMPISISIAILIRIPISIYKKLLKDIYINKIMHMEHHKTQPLYPLVQPHQVAIITERAAHRSNRPMQNCEMYNCTIFWSIFPCSRQPRSPFSSVKENMEKADLIFVTSLTSQASGEKIAMWRIFSFPCITIAGKSKNSLHVDKFQMSSHDRSGKI